MTLKSEIFSSVRWTTFSMISKAAFQLLQMAILARLLAPSDFGLMALVVAVVVFAQTFSDMGISNAIIHHQEINHEVRSSLYWLNVSASVFLMLLLMVTSQLIASWFNEPRLQPVLMIVASSFLIVALGQQLRVIAEKHLHFQKLAAIEVSAAFLGFVVALIVGFSGGGVYALVAGMLAGVGFTTLLSWWILAEGWRPMWRCNLTEIRKFTSFGAYMIGYNLTNTINMQADILIGGRLLGTANLGSYSVSKDLSLRLAMIINPIVTRVGFPVMAKSQGDHALRKSIYLKTLLMTASVNFPLYLLMVFFAPEIVHIVLGSKWEEAVPLLRVLALWALIRSTGNPSGSLVFSMGRADLAFWWSLGITLFFVPLFWLGAHYGVEGLALSALVSMIVLPLPQWMFLVRPLCGAKFVEYFTQLAKPFGIAAMAVTAAVIAATPFDADVIRLGLGVLVGGFFYLVLSRWLNRTWFGALAELLLGRARSLRYLA